MGRPALTYHVAPKYGVNLIGFVSGNFGLAAAARNTAHVLHKRGIPLRIVDIDLHDGRCRQDLSCDDLGTNGPEPAPFSINLFHMNPPEIGYAIGSVPAIDPQTRLNACVPFWELPALPTSWLPTLGAMRFVLTPSRFIHSTVTSALPELPCFLYPQAALLPDGIVPDRARFGLPEHALVYMTAFDMNSDIDRKNPWAAIRAFQTAFPEPKDEYLVVKMSANEHARKLWASQVAALQSIADSSPNIVLVDEILSYPDVLALYAACDVFVALHRSEGLGLCLMEAMSLGKAVVATGWSGNMDFTTPENSCLVEYELVPVSSDHPAYDPANLASPPVWAESRIDHGASCLLRLRDDPAYRKRLGGRARQDMAERRRMFWRGLVWDQVKQQVLDRNSRLWASERRGY